MRGILGATTLVVQDAEVKPKSTTEVVPPNCVLKSYKIVSI